MTSFGSLIGAGSSETVTVIVSDSLAVAEDTAAIFDLFANDTGVWSVLAYTIQSGDAAVAGTTYNPGEESRLVPGVGSIVLRSDGTGTFTPATNYNGAAPAVGVLCVGEGGVVRHQTLGISVTPVNDPPTARDIAGVSIDSDGDLSTVYLDFGAAIADPDGDTVTITLVDGAAAIFDAPITLDGGALTIDSGTLIGTLVPTPGRTDPIVTTYTVTDGALTATGAITVVVAEVTNTGGYSPIKIHNPSDPHDLARVAFADTWMQELGPRWPYIGAPDGNGNPTLVSAPPYSAGQGLFSLDNREPWLYVRQRIAYFLWEITGDVAFFDYCKHLCETYMAAVTGTGTWTIIGSTGGDPTDVKYLYGETATIYYNLTGSTVYYPQAEAIYTQTLSTYPATYNAGSAALWTERHTAYALRNCRFRYVQSGGDTEVLDQALAYVDLVLTMSAGTGMPWHGENKHEGSADTTPICSGFMGAILHEDMFQMWRITRRTDILQWCFDNAAGLVTYGLYVADHQEEPEFAGLEGLRIPAYLFSVTAQRPEGTAADMRHSRDAAAWLDRGIFCGTLLGEDVTALTDARDELLSAALVDDAYWTRATPLYPRRRSNPPRAFNWLWQLLYALLHDTGAAPPIRPVILTEGTITGSTQQGATLTFAPGTARGTPTPTVTWVWQLDGANITGTDDADTYVTDAIGDHRVVVTATNEAGVASYVTNTITVVPAGAPEVTLQPVAQSALVDATDVEFSCAFTGLPDPTATPQLDTGSGFADTATGTLVATATTATWNPGTITSGMDGWLVRFRLNNGVGADVYTEAAGLAVISQQGAFRVTGAAQNVTVVATAGSAGFLGWTWGGWIRLVTKANNAQVLSVEGVAGRTVYLLDLDNTNELTVADSQTGPGTGVWTPQGGGATSSPATGVWYWVTLRGPPTHPGVFHATYRAAGSPTTYEMTRANGLENSITVISQYFGGGAGGGSTIEMQHVRLYNSRLTDQQCIDEQTNFNPTGAVYFLRATDAGGGALALTDRSGNGVTPAITGATYTSDGPLTGSVP